MIAGGALAPGGPALWTVVCGAVPFLSDAMLTIIRRGRAGERLMEAHSQHAYQRLHRAGWSHQAVSAVYALLAAAGVALALALGTEAAWRVLAVMAATFAAWALAVRAMFAAKRER